MRHPKRPKARLVFVDNSGEDHPPKRVPMPSRSSLPRCGARTRARVTCSSCGAEARVNAVCPACGAAQPEAFCKAPPVRDPRTGKPVNGRCRRHGGRATGPRTAEGRAAALANLELGRMPHAERRQRADDANDTAAEEPRSSAA